MSGDDKAVYPRPRGPRRRTRVAQEHLEGALDNMLGEVASRGGDEVIDALWNSVGQAFARQLAIG